MPFCTKVLGASVLSVLLMSQPRVSARAAASSTTFCMAAGNLLKASSLTKTTFLDAQAFASMKRSENSQALEVTPVVAEVFTI